MAGLLLNEFDVTMKLADGPISPRLTQTESRILRSLADKASSSDIGQRLDLPECTALRQIDNVVQKLQIYTVIQDGIRGSRTDLIFVDQRTRRRRHQIHEPL